METESTLAKLTARYGADMSKSPLGGGTNTPSTFAGQNYSSGYPGQTLH